MLSVYILPRHFSRFFNTAQKQQVCEKKPVAKRLSVRSTTPTREQAPKFRREKLFLIIKLVHRHIRSHANF